ncbi:MAG: hypothetical protein ACXVNM_10785 [Bacteroidia bacterium]
MPVIKSIRKVLGALPNVGRGISAMIFNAAAFLVLKNSGNKESLSAYSWFLVIANLFVTLTGWGLRDYSVKEYVKDLSSASSRFSLLFSGKIPLLIISFCLIFFIPFTNSFKLGLVTLVFLRTMMALTDPLVLSYNRTLKVFLLESVIYLPAFIVICFYPGIHMHLIKLLLIIEVLRLVISFLSIKDKGVLRLKWINPFGFLYDTRFYFFIALFSFCMSRIDVYILGFFSINYFFADYNIVLNLVAFTQIIIASVYNNNIKSIFRINLLEANRILDKLTLQFFLLSIVASLAITGISRFIYDIELNAGFYLLLFVNVFFYCLTLKYVYILNHAGKPRYFLIAAIISSLVNTAGAIILVPLLQIYGALIANTVGVIVLVGILNLLVARNKILFKAVKP